MPHKDKAARSKYIKEYYERNKERLKSNNNAYYHANKEKLSGQRKVYARKYNAENITKRKTAHKEYYETNKSKICAYQKTYRANNKSKVLSRIREYQLRKAERAPSWLSAEQKWLMKEIYELAALRSALTGISWHVDHIVPLRGKQVSGLHVPWNLQVIPGLDNIRKGNTFMETNDADQT